MREKLEKLLQKDKKSLTLMTIAVATLLLLLIGATYAYFAAQAGGGTGTDINASTATTDSLSFSVGKDIEIEATMENFAEGMNNLHGETTATATLKANNVMNQATGRYNVFFIIDNNGFEYSTEDGRTELLMKVTDPNGNEVENITGLKRVEGGFDITTRTGGFLIMADYDIETTPTENFKAQTWKLEITFVNLDVDQNINKGKTFNGRFYITKEQESTYELAVINSMEAIANSNSVTANLTSIKGTSEIAKYYYAIEEDTSGMAYIGAGISVAQLANSLAVKDSDYIESDKPTHTFNGLKTNAKYKVYSYAKDIYGIKSNVYETSVITGDYALPKVTALNHTKTLNSITVTATAERGSNEVSKYYFSKDNGNTWSEGQESNVYIFNDLLDTTEYKIKVKVEDTNGVYSTEYYEAISTSTYINPSITTVNATKTYNSISLTTTATGGTSSVAKYYYKVGTGNWSEAQTTNTYNITSLEGNTTYTIYIKVEDANGRVSNEYTLDVTTNTYVLPSVTATTSVTTNSITLNATGTNGDGTITKYMYSKDGGSNWITQDSTSLTNAHTFEDLTPGATYQIRVKVVDSNNRESSIYSTSVTITGNFSNSTEDTTSIYNGSAKRITVNVSPTPTNIYYSTTIELTESNYSSSGTTANPSRTDAGTTTVYWCAVKSGYNTYCSSNTITISKKSPTFTISSATSTINSSSKTSLVTYAYTGDGTIRCTPKSPSTATYASCNVNTSTKTITFTRIAAGTQTFTISAAAGTNYSAGTSKTVTITVEYRESLAEDCIGQNMATCFKNNYTKDSDIYYHTSSLANSAEDNSYRYAGADPDNYVCFGSSAATCPADNLYRIIGIFGSQVKLIKNTSIGQYPWSGSKDNKLNGWAESTLNTSTLNGTYLSGLGTTWSEKIADTTWYVGGMSSEKAIHSNAKTVYNYELGLSKSGTTHDAKIGLMYVSEYYYAASPTYWTYLGYNGSDETKDYIAAKASNWMYLGSSEWTISRNSNYSWHAILVNGSGDVSYGNVYSTEGARPTFYLNSSVTLTSGSGTQSNPYRIS